jgi:hypothetical protein
VQPEQNFRKGAVPVATVMTKKKKPSGEKPRKDMALIKPHLAQPLRELADKHERSFAFAVNKAVQYFLAAVDRGETSL